MKTLFLHPSIGEVTICKSRRARRISISVRPPGIVRLTMPNGVSTVQSMQFLESKVDWIVAAKAKLASKVKPEPVIEMPFSTRRHTLKLNPSPVALITVRVASGEISIRYPLEENFAAEAVQQAIKKGIEEAWRIEARELLPGRVAQLASQHNLKYRSVTVRNTRSRWGSCSARDDISLSIRLMKLPDHLIDYIILHELSHTVHKNHGPRFHTLLNTLTENNHPKLRLEIRKAY